MNTILCDKCGATIPLRELTSDDNPQPNAGHTCKICEPPKEALGRKGGCGIFFHILAVVVFGAAGIGLQKCSFDKVAELRQLARVPKTDVQAAVPGEINLKGSAKAMEGRGGRALLKSTDTKTACLYFRYHVEREERDSDGDTRWVTVTDKTEFVPQFLLRDKTGEIAIRPSPRVDWSIPQSHTRRAGKMRYTEYRLDPGSNIFVFGYAEADSGSGAEEEVNTSSFVVGFDRVGDYQPLISSEGELEERTGRATTSLIACWAGLVLIGAATVVLFSLTGLHRLLVYFWVLSAAIGLVLVFLGVAMMRSDLRSAHDRVLRQDATVRSVIADSLDARDISWNQRWETLGDLEDKLELTDAQRERLRRVRIDLAAAARRVEEQTWKFPYNLIAPSLDLEALPDPPLPPEDEKKLQQLESTFQKAELSGIGTWLWGIGGLAGAVLATFFGFRSVKWKRMTENLKTSSTKGVAYGLTELSGIIDLPEGIDPLRGPLSRKPCVTYDYKIKEKRGSGKNAKWVVVHHEEKRNQFLCRDREGTFRINPDGAKLMCWRKETKTQGRRQHVENRLQFGDPLYAIGMASIDPETGDTLYLCKPEPKDEPFVLSSFTERAVVAKRGFRAILWLTLAYASVLLAALMIFASRGAFSPADYLAAALVGPAYLTILTIFLHYNDLVFLRQRARRNWSNIEVSLKKRHDLLPAMINIAKSFMAHESGIQSRLAAMRDSYGGGISLNPDGARQFLEEGREAGGLFMGLIEDYPDLKASTQTSLVMRQLIALEDEIAFMRAGYNDAVTEYNTRISVIPDRFLAQIGRMSPMDILNYQSEVIPIPEVTQETWRRQQVIDANQASAAGDETAQDLWTATPLPVPDPDAPVIDSIGERAYLYASVLDEEGEMRTRQLEMIREAEGDVMADTVTVQIEAIQQMDPWSRLSYSRASMPNLRGMSAEAYLRFKGLIRRLIEADERISTYEYAFEKALSFLVDPVFTPFEPPAIQHTAVATLAESVGVLQAHLSDPTKEDNLGGYDTAMAEVFLATAEIRHEVYRSCHETFTGGGGGGGGESESTQFMLLQALNDGLFLGVGD